MTTTLTPVDASAMRKVGSKRWRKQLLPIAKITYGSQVIDFTRDKLARIADSVNRRAYDMVPLLVDDGQKGHDVGPEQTRGRLVGVELTRDGLDGIFDLSESTDALVKTHPEVGVSCRIVSDLSRADGSKFSDALEHVLLTLRPRLTGMSAWRSLSLARSAVNAHTIDLSESWYSPDARSGLNHPLVIEAEQQAAAAQAERAEIAMQLQMQRGNNDIVELGDEQMAVRAYLERELPTHTVLKEANR